MNVLILVLHALSLLRVQLIKPPTPQLHLYQLSSGKLISNVLIISLHGTGVNQSGALTDLPSWLHDFLTSQPTKHSTLRCRHSRNSFPPSQLKSAAGRNAHIRSSSDNSNKRRCPALALCNAPVTSTHPTPAPLAVQPVVQLNTDLFRTNINSPSSSNKIEIPAATVV